MVDEPAADLATTTLDSAALAPLAGTLKSPRTQVAGP